MEINLDSLSQKVTGVVDARDKEKIMASYWRRVLAEKDDSEIEKCDREKEKREREKKKRSYNIQMSACNTVRICPVNHVAHWRAAIEI